MTNSTGMFKILDYSLDGGSITVEYNRVQYVLDERIESETKGIWYDDYPTKGNVVNEELQQNLWYSLYKHNNEK